jgi:predicted nuclease of restriction endonuclease-like (RecB) superfamily
LLEKYEILEMNKNEIILYQSLLEDIKKRIRKGQTKAILAANAELIAMYWDIGKMILQRQQTEGWGTHIIKNLATDMKNEVAELKGFSERNIGYMLSFAKAYTFFDNKINEDSPILQQPVAKLESEQSIDTLKHLFGRIPWGHHILLLD